MSEKTKQIPTDRMEQYFAGFSKRFLQKENSTADVEVLGMDLGDQIEAEGVRLIGITYEPKTRELEVELDGGDLRSFKPKEVWAIEEDDGFIRTLEIVRDDDTKEIVRVRRQARRLTEPRALRRIGGDSARCAARKATNGRRRAEVVVSDHVRCGGPRREPRPGGTSSNDRSTERRP
jgi:hypothetical protein